MDKVGKYMNEKGICSRPTTRLILFSLLEEGILIEKERRNTYFHDLVIDEDYSFEGLLTEVFLDRVEDLKESLRPFNILIPDKKILTNHAVTKNAKETLLTISIVNADKPHQEKEKEVYTPKQLEKIQLDIQNKIVDNAHKRLKDQVYPPRKTKTKTKTRRKG